MHELTQVFPTREKAKECDILMTGTCVAGKASLSHQRYCIQSWANIITQASSGIWTRSILPGASKPQHETNAMMPTMGSLNQGDDSRLPIPTCLFAKLGGSNQLDGSREGLSCPLRRAGVGSKWSREDGEWYQVASVGFINGIRILPVGTSPSCPLAFLLFCTRYERRT